MEPDGLERLWTPHRMAYIKDKEPGVPAGELCPFCHIPTLPDAEALVVARGEYVYAVLNLYPYNPGHMMVVPYRHIPEFTDLTPDEYGETADFTQRGMRALRDVSAPHGFNLGVNQGTAAGAGIAAHLHHHIVPRWGGDTSFMTTVGGAKVLPELLPDTRALLAGAWESTT